MKIGHRNLYRTLGVMGAVALVLASCGEDEISQQEEENVASGNCGEINMAINDWVGYKADAYVIGHVAEEEFGCQMNYIPIKEELAWAEFGTGEIDVIIEDWGHPGLERQYFEESGDGTAMNIGTTGNPSIIGWYVPPWLAKEHPDITNWKNLNKYADEFETSESDGQGQFLGSDPSYKQYDEAIIENLGLDFKVVFSGSEAATIQAFKRAEENKEWLIGYFWEPQWFHADVPLVQVKLPPYYEGCDDDPQQVDCDYEQLMLNKIVSTEWVEEGGPGVELVKNFEWTNEDQNLVAKWITEDGLSEEEAAAKWVKENPDKVDAWLQGIEV
jgi:glycine betaine/proline transport system substrate-binding protein